MQLTLAYLIKRTIFLFNIIKIQRKLKEKRVTKTKKTKTRSILKKT